MSPRHRPGREARTFEVTEPLHDRPIGQRDPCSQVAEAQGELLSSMGRVASALDNAMIESFFGTLQLELLDRRTWGTRAELARAIFKWIEGWYNPRRRHTSIGGLSPLEYERRR